MCTPSPIIKVACQTWQREGNNFFISTDPRLLSIKAVNAAFREDFVYWVKEPFPEEVLRQMLFGSVSFGVYSRIHSSQPRNGLEPSNLDNTEQVGLARVVTDGVTFVYLADFYILPVYQGRGLGKWLIDCVSEIFSAGNMPHLRRVMLITDGQRMQNFYQKTLGVKVVGQEKREDMGTVLSFMCGRPNA